jgi:rhamnose utilization protein RhaD (predicted bifunctional aldolase and dehydrogenase)
MVALNSADMPLPQARSKEFTSLLRLSADIGRDPLLIQASSGNTSVKLDEVMWIKASGTWLADAEREEIFVPVDLKEALSAVHQNREAPVDWETQSGVRLRASIETTMHAVLPSRVVAHVHSVNTIGWAVREDGRARLNERLRGLSWCWIRYVPSGLPLAQEIQKALSGCPDANIFVLANHGLVVRGDTCGEVRRLLDFVEDRLALSPAEAPEPNYNLLSCIAGRSGWRVPDHATVHSLATDRNSRSIVAGGVLFPCQAIFSAGSAAVLPPREEVAARMQAENPERPFFLVEGCGVVVNERMTRADMEMLVGLAEVVRRIDRSAPLRYLSEAELQLVLNEDAHDYRLRAGSVHKREQAPA